jgi:hypothetical protein
MPKPHTKSRAQIFSGYVRLWMLMKGLSIKEAANVSGIDYRLLQRWTSKGISRRGLNTEEPLKKLARAMRWKESRIDDLFVALRGPDERHWNRRSPQDEFNKRWSYLIDRAWAVLRFGDYTEFNKLVHAVDDTYHSTIARIRQDPDPEEADFLEALDARKRKAPGD